MLSSSYTTTGSVQVAFRFFQATRRINVLLAFDKTGTIKYVV